MLRRVPPPLALILATVAVLAVAWTLVLPPFQGPDEVPHVAYTQLIVENHEMPFKPGGDYNPPGVSAYSTEMTTALMQSGFGELEQNPSARPLWTAADFKQWSDVDRALGPGTRGDGGYTSSLKNPPLYYLYEAIPYGVAHGGSIFDRAALMRLANVPLLLLALVFVWLLTGEVVGRGWPQVVSTLSAALIPQLLNLTATVDPDIMLVAAWSAGLYLSVLIVKRGASRGLVAWLAVACVAGALTHARSFPLFLPAILAVVIALARERGWSRVTPLRAAAGLVGVYLFGVAVASAYGHGGLRQFASYVWQFYLPKLGFMTPTLGPPGYEFRQAVPDRLWGTLAQLEVTLPHTLETAMYWLSLAALVALVAALVARRRSLREQLPAALVLGSALIALVVGLHLASYRALVADPSDPVFTARYLLPLLPLFGLAVVVIARALPRRVQPVFCGLVLALGVALQFESFGLLLERFYA